MTGKYVYGIDCEDEENGFWCRVDSDHELNDKEKNLIMKAACMEEIVRSNIANGFCYDVTPVHIDGVTAAIGDDLVWDDPDDYPKVKKVPVDQKFEDELNKLLSATTIDILEENELNRLFHQSPD